MQKRTALTAEQYSAIAGFRYELRRFLAFSEAAAAAEDLPAQQHQALLAIAGRPPGDPASVGYVAEQLLIAPHTPAELTLRMVEAGLLAKSPSALDRRRMELTLTEKARELLGRLTEAHLQELQTLKPALLRVLDHAAAGGFQPSLTEQIAPGTN